MLLSNNSKSFIYVIREVNSYMADTSISQIAYILALIGGILLVIFGLISLIGSSFGPSFLYWGWGFAMLRLRRHHQHHLRCHCNNWCKKRKYSCLGNRTHNRWHHRRWLRRTTGCFGRITRNNCSNNQKSIGTLEFDSSKSDWLILEA